jgi:hypothetical protein
MFIDNSIEWFPVLILDCLFSNVWYNGAEKQRRPLQKRAVSSQSGGRLVLMREQININRGEVLGIGKLKVPRSPDFDFTIPVLSFLVIKEHGGGYVSICIHLQIDGYGKTEQDAILDMIDSVTFFLRENFTNSACKDMAWVRLEELLYESTHEEMELWDAYHRVQVRLSMLGKSTDNTEELWAWINQLQKRVERLEDAAAQRIKKELNTLLLLIKIGYTPLNRNI